MRRAILALLLTATSAPALAQEAGAGDEAKVTELSRQWGEAAKARDTVGTWIHYAADAVLMPPNGPAIEGTEGLRAFWVGAMKNPDLTLTFAPTHVVVSEGGDMAYDIGTYQMTTKSADGTMEDEGKYLVVWRKMDGEWKVVADMFNSNQPASGH